MEKSGAIGVILMSPPGGRMEELKCVLDECNTPLNIPASSLKFNARIAR